MLRGRLYKQSGAVFWSDDYTEVSRRSARAGVLHGRPRAVALLELARRGARGVDHHPPAHHRLLGFIESFKLAGSANVQGFSYDQYTLGGTPVSNAIAYVATVSLQLGF